MSLYPFTVAANPAGARARAADDAEVDLVLRTGRERACEDRGQPLERAGKLVMGKRKAVTDGPFAEANDVVSGYRLILAKDLNEAAELSKGCPILVVDGQVEVRPVMKLSM